MEPPTKKQRKLSHSLTYQRAFFTRQQANDVLRDLKAEVRFPPERHRVRVHGKWHPIPREQVAYGAPDARGQTPAYRFSGNLAPSRSWTEEAWLIPIVDRVEAVVGARPNFVLINLYPDGRSRIGFHSDSERGLVPGRPIVSLTFGAERDFQVRRRGETKVARTFVLHHGSLLIMPWEFNKENQHGVPKRAKVAGPRYNLTFRYMEPVSA